MGIVENVFKIGIGPSSSHTVGPMKATRDYLLRCFEEIDPGSIRRICVELYGSLALTGVGHATDKAVLLGLTGEKPDTVAVEKIAGYVAAIQTRKKILLLGKREIDFDPEKDVVYFFREALPEHANGMAIGVYGEGGVKLHGDVYFSIGGGIVRTKRQYLEEQNAVASSFNGSPATEEKPDFFDEKELLRLCGKHGLSIAGLMWKIAAEEKRTEETGRYLAEVWKTMRVCVQNGIRAEDPVLPGGLNVERRAPVLYRRLKERKGGLAKDPALFLDWVSAYALAVNEENAAGHRVVTAPTNGSAGVIPAVMHYLRDFYPKEFGEKQALDFLMTASAVGHLYQKGASISAAEMGCQGEIGVSSSMAAAALCEFMGGTPNQATNAAEIGMEHHLGMTCDPIDGLVQVPCIERNATGAIKAINAARLSLARTKQRISLDQVIKTMFETGRDMSKKYKETAKGGLALHCKDEAPRSTRPTEEYSITQNQVAC